MMAASASDGSSETAQEVSIPNTGGIASERVGHDGQESEATLQPYCDSNVSEEQESEARQQQQPAQSRLTWSEWATKHKVILQAAVKATALFVFCLVFLIFLLKALLPPIDYQDRSAVKIPKSFEDLKRRVLPRVLSATTDTAVCAFVLLKQPQRCPADLQGAQLRPRAGLMDRSLSLVSLMDAARYVI